MAGVNNERCRLPPHGQAVGVSIGNTILIVDFPKFLDTLTKTDT
jgi:hypothetical protein